MLVSVEFFIVPAIRSQVLYVFLVLAHDRQGIVVSAEISVDHGLAVA